MSHSSPSHLSQAWQYLVRSLRLRCPVCGVSPLFKPARQIRSVTDWFEPLPGCPRCDYVYDQEPGYFMLALWSLDYGAAAFVGLALLLVLFNYFELTSLQLILFTLIPTALFAMLIVRHAKAIYLAIDHYFFHDDIKNKTAESRRIEPSEE